MTSPDESPIELGREIPFRIGALEVRPASREVVLGGRREVIEPRVLQVLVALARRRGEVVSRDDLIGACWAGRVVGDDAINRAIMGVRRIGDAFGGFAIETIPRVGHRLTEDTPETESAPSSSSKPRIAVLPFANLSGEPDQAYFSDGISEDIITDLSKISALFVVARNTAFALRGKPMDLREVARELGVSHVLEGSVRKDGGRVRITAQLVDGATGGPIWAERYDRRLDDIFGVQDEISHQVVSALKLRLLPEERRAIEMRYTTSAEAYDLYLLARKQYVTGDQGDPDWGRAIIRLAQRAVEIDPNYAVAWAYLALGQVGSQHMYGGGGDRGWAAVERALALNPDLGIAHAVKARIFFDTGRIDEANREIATALRLNSKSSVVQYSAGIVFFYQQRVDEAVAHFDAAQALDDTDYNAAAFLLSCYDRQGDSAAALRTAAITLAHVENVLAHDRNNSLAIATGARALAVLGQTQRAREWLDRALLIRPDSYVARYNVAIVLAHYLHELEAALDALEPALDRMSAGFLGLVRLTGYLDQLREFPRFKAMIAKSESRLAKEDTSSR
jgi:adenylate cyclase